VAKKIHPGHRTWVCGVYVCRRPTVPEQWVWLGRSQAEEGKRGKALSRRSAGSHYLGEASGATIHTRFPWLLHGSSGDGCNVKMGKMTVQISVLEAGAIQEYFCVKLPTSVSSAKSWRRS
jgi:hypothetical protein